MWTGKTPWGAWVLTPKNTVAQWRLFATRMACHLDQLPLCGPCLVLGTWRVEKSRPVPHLKLSNPTGRQNGGISHRWRKRQSLALQSKFRPYSSKELDTAGHFQEAFKGWDVREGLQGEEALMAF